MWEISIAVASLNIDIAKFVYQTLKTQTTALETVVTCYEQFDNFYIVVGCPLEQQQKVKIEIENCIIKVVCNFFKEKFLTENLRLPFHESISLMAFKKALINFDKETDFYLISKNLVLDKNINLDSFYSFKLKSLREKWEELVMLANENSDYLGSSEAFFDLLKFLIDNLEVCEEEINVFQQETGYLIEAKGDEISCGSKEGLVGSLIEISPKKINMYCKSDDKTANFLSKLFDERFNVCYNKNIEKLDKFSISK